MIKKFIRFITFVDLPIRQKFILFSMCVLFWFMVMFAINITASISIDKKTNNIVNQIVPVDRTTQMITNKLQRLGTDIAKISNTSDAVDFDSIYNTSRTRIDDIILFTTALTNGGRVADINRDRKRLVNSFTILPAGPALKAEKYSNELISILKSIETSLSEIADTRANIISGNARFDSSFRENISLYQRSLQNGISLTEEFSGRVTSQYNANLLNVEHTTRLTLYTFIAVLVIASILLVIFTISISNAIAIPVTSIIRQISDLGAGKIDLTQKIEIRSKDEIGILSEKFNQLTEEIHDIVTFKKVIEEDHHIDDVYTRMGNAFREKCGLDDFIIFEVEGSKNKMKPVYPIMLNDGELSCNEDILADCDLCKVITTGHLISSATYKDVCKQFRPGTNKLHLCIPMIIGGKTGGVVQFLFNDDSLNIHDQRMFKAEQYITESLSVIEAKRLTNTLRESALKDTLTGLYNRRFLQEYTETLISGLLRRKKSAGLIMCDLDFFKQVNDTYGHNAGDIVLKETSNIIRKCVREADLVIRFGGEEFLILLMDINKGETMKVAEKIRAAVGKAKIKIPEGTVNKTISLGISEFPIDTEGFWQAIKFADVALYKAKDMGRNKAIRFTEDMWTENEV